VNHTDYMRTALELAKKGTGFVNPNPLVGAVIVKNGTVIGKGWHRKYGELHAERNAFADCENNNNDCSGADIYVTLEPCCHHGKTPPCTDAIIEHGIKRVFIGSPDPNPLVSGKGVKILREHGIEVHENILRDECDRLNEIFFHWITAQKPFVTLKYAMTMDGKIACCNGLSKWITGEEARNHVQYERLRHSAVMVGTGTVSADDPMLTCRLENGRNPIRILCDTNLKTKYNTNIISTAKEIPTIVATSHVCLIRQSLYHDAGCEVIEVPRKDGKVDLNILMEKLAERNIDSILLEGGGELSWSALDSGIVNKVQAYIAPKIFGGQDAKTPVGGMGVSSPDNAFMLTDPEVFRFGNDIMLESKVIYR